MKIKYQFVTGECSEIEVDDEIGTVILESRRAEHANNEKQRYHCISYDAIDYEGEEYADFDTPQTVIENKELKTQLSSAFETLTPTQNRRLVMYSEGKSYRAIARIEGVSDHKKIIKSVEGARKKIKKFLKF